MIDSYDRNVMGLNNGGHLYMIKEIVPAMKKLLLAVRENI
jgi:hypothetical protein